MMRSPVPGGDAVAFRDLDLDDLARHGRPDRDRPAGARAAPRASAEAFLAGPGTIR